jgi:hypothetical protein
MHDLPDKPPFARLLDGLHRYQPNVLDFSIEFPDLEVSSRPFLESSTVTVPLDLDSDLPLGMDFASCSRLHRAFVSSIARPAPGCTLHAFRHLFVGSYVVSIDDVPVFIRNGTIPESHFLFI